MDRRELEKLGKARRGEADPHVRDRISAVIMHDGMGMTRDEVAMALAQCPRWVGKWVARYRKGGTSALRNLPRTGRRPKVTRKKLRAVFARLPRYVTPVQCMLAIRKAAGVRFHMTYVRKLMHAFRLSAKRPRLVHVNRADRGEVERWQRKTLGEIPRLQRAGYAIVVQDESFVKRDSPSSPRFWSRIRDPVCIPYVGDHGKVVAYGGISVDGRQAFRTYDRFDSATYVRHLRVLNRRFGKVAVIGDRAPQHRARRVRDFLRDNPDVRITGLPAGSPFLNAVEGVWANMKRAVVDSQYCPTLQDLRHAISEYLRTTRHRVDVMAHLARTPPAGGTNF